MPVRKDLHKVLVIGSGPIIIGQAAEFDYAGSQACRALRDEGIEVALVNSNPATIMTDTHMADRVYMEPLTVDSVARIIRREKPGGLLPTLGGQVGLNMALELSKCGVLADEGVLLLGTSLEAIEKAEDRRQFKAMLEAIGEPVPPSAIVTSIEEALSFAAENGYPVIVRPAYTLGGTGGGIAAGARELREIAGRGLKQSIIKQLLIEKSIAGWKEIEFEVIRDAADTCLTICSMENIDPIGVHTGDSIVCAPAQTLTNREFQMLRAASLKIIRALGVEGGCNIQFALDPYSFDYYVIEVNPRVSRSSALASKATGYPIAKVAAKIAVGLCLDEIPNFVTGQTTACCEPVIDYCVLKFPRWPFDKFNLARRTLGTQMKATGEVMSIGRTFEEALLKALRSLEIDKTDLRSPHHAALATDKLLRCLQIPDDERLFAVAEALRRGIDGQEICRLSRIDPFFVRKLTHIVNMEAELAAAGNPEHLDAGLLQRAKQMGFSDRSIAALTASPEEAVRCRRLAAGIKPSFKMVDTCAGEFEATTPYYYSTYDPEDEVRPSHRRKVLVLGAGPIRIGQGVEFDYCSVHSIWALRDEGLETIIINNNPETVSTDFDTADRLYFEPLVPEEVLNVIDKERPDGVIVQFGGQTAINLAAPLARAGVKILGTSVADIDRAEDRDKFDHLLEELGIRRPPGGTATSVAQALRIAGRISYPVLVRPSYVLGGRAMEIVYNAAELQDYMSRAVKVSPHHPVLVDKYLRGVELEVDAVSDGQDVLVPGIMEHIERAGIHSGDSIAVYPPLNLTPPLAAEIVSCTSRLARALHIRGVINIQFVVHEGVLYVLEVNPRSSRTVPFLSKVTGVPLIRLATRICLGRTLAEQGYGSGLCRPSPYAAVKVPVFSFAKLFDLDTSLGPEMKSTGEVIGIDYQPAHALYKGMLAAGLSIPAPGGRGNLLATIADKDKEEATPLIKGFAAQGFTVYATAGTASRLEQEGLSVQRVSKISEGSTQITDLISNGSIDLVINTLTRGKEPQRDGFRIRRAAVEYNIPCLTSLDTARALLWALRDLNQGARPSLLAVQEYLAQAQAVDLQPPAIELQ